MAAKMSRKEFKEWVARVMQSLPSAWQPYLVNVVVEVADWPDDDLLHHAGLSEEEIEAGESLLGLFDPLELPLGGGDVIDADTMLHRLWIFRVPHLEEFPDPKRLRIEIRKTVVHELAHHFGWTERDLETFDDDPNPFKDELTPEA